VLIYQDEGEGLLAQRDELRAHVEYLTGESKRERKRERAQGRGSMYKAVGE
jgi:hypothetical protein